MLLDDDEARLPDTAAARTALESIFTDQARLGDTPFQRRGMRRVPNPP
ncbi:MAG: hypothetical protein HIU86_06385 [Acidobacteria bacterium]|nr:hypothetical protein [Acidobacteriota bacterium]